MPKRSNEFQRLIKLIVGQLDKSATVRESVEMPDPAGGDAPREIDILVEGQIIETRIHIAIETTAKSRPVDIGWVDQMIGKYSGLNINKVVLVSESGFSKKAQKKAASVGIDALTLDEAKDREWLEYVEALGPMRIQEVFCRCLSVNPICLRDGRIWNVPNHRTNSIIRMVDSEEGIPLSQYVHHVVNHQQFRQFYFESYSNVPLENGRHSFPCNIDLEGSWELQDMHGRYHSVTNLVLLVEATEANVSVDLEAVPRHGKLDRLG
ncbi:MAG: hypothetical protein AAF530_07950 [Pseudomonadota bacterium]